MRFADIDVWKRHDENKVWYLTRDYEEDISARYSRHHSAYICDVSVTKYNDRWEEIGYEATSALLTDADLGRADVIGER